MHSLTVFDPSGAVEISRLHAPRLSGVEGKKIAMLSNDMWQAHRMLPMLRGFLEAAGATVIPETEFPMGNVLIDRDETVDAVVASGADAVLIGNAS